MTAVTRTTSRGQLVTLSFGQANVAASQTDVQLVAADPSGNDGYALPFDGEIVGIGYNLSAARTAGTCTVGVTIGGTEDADTTVSIPGDSATVKGYQRISRGRCPFAAGDVIGVEITTNAGHLPTTTDLTVTVLALVYLEGI